MKYILFVFITLVIFPLSSASSAEETTFERVMRTNTLRCGYIIYPPELSKDPNTGKLSGIVYDVFEEIGKKANLKIEWTEEAPIANAFDGLYAERYDAVCASYFENAPRARRVIFSNPLNYTATYAYAKSGDMRFNDDFNLINEPDVTISVIDGEISAFIAKEKFPNATVHALPHTVSNPSDALVDLSNGKADITFSGQATAQLFMNNNPNKIRLVSEKPIQAYAQSLASFHPNDYQLKFFIDSSLRSLQASGFVESTLKKYDPYQTTFIPLATPYKIKGAE